MQGLQFVVAIYILIEQRLCNVCSIEGQCGACNPAISMPPFTTSELCQEQVIFIFCPAALIQSRKDVAGVQHFDEL